MKSPFIRTITPVASGLGLALFLFVSSGIGQDRSNGQSRGLGPAPERPGPGFSMDNNPGVTGRQASDNHGNPGFDSQNNPGVQGSEFGRSTAQGASENAASHRDSNTGSSPVGRREERVVEVASSSINADERATEAASSKSESRGRFSGSLLNMGLGGDHNGSVEARPTPKGHHHGWEKGTHNPHRFAASPTPTPNASPSATVSPTATPNPTATATPTPNPTG